MKVGVYLPANFLAFTGEEAQRCARLLAAEKIQSQVQRYVDQHGWDVANDEGHWRQYQQARMAEEYRDDDW